MKKSGSLFFSLLCNDRDVSRDYDHGASKASKDGAQLHANRIFVVLTTTRAKTAVDKRRAIQFGGPFIEESLDCIVVGQPPRKFSVRRFPRSIDRWLFAVPRKRRSKMRSCEYGGKKISPPLSRAVISLSSPFP